MYTRDLLNEVKRLREEWLAKQAANQKTEEKNEK